MSGLLGRIDYKARLEGVHAVDCKAALVGQLHSEVACLVFRIQIVLHELAEVPAGVEVEHVLEEGEVVVEGKNYVANAAMQRSTFSRTL